MSRRPTRHAATDLCHPLVLAALATLLVNDHLLKGAGVVPAAVTGKLSDVAGLLLFPVLLVAIARAACGILGARIRDRLLIHGAVLLTVVGFAALKLSPSVNALAAAAWGHNVMDASDLFALPACGVAWLLLLDRARATTRDHAPRLRWHHATVVAIAAFASIATPAPRYPRNYPAWQTVTNTPTKLGCAELDAWVAKSGKTGVGLHVAHRPVGGGPCPVVITSARLVVRGIYRGTSRAPLGVILHGTVAKPGSIVDHTYDGAVPPAESTPGSGPIYVPFAFDNNKTWNQRYRDGTFELELEVGGAKHTWTLPATHRLRGYHVEAYPYGPRPARKLWRAR